MSEILIVIIIILLIVAVVFLCRGIEVIRKVTGIFQTSAKSQQLREEEQPKSLSAMTSIYLPEIEKDFPDFNYFEFKNVVHNTLYSAFLAIDTKDLKKLVQCSQRLQETIELEIENDSNSNIERHYQEIQIHETEISKYTKQNGRCIISLQSSVGYRNWTEKDGELILGNREHKKQTRFNSELIYIQDQELVSEFSENLMGNNCPNCGGTISTLGEKVCQYCGSAIQEIHLKVWSLDNYDEV